VQTSKRQRRVLGEICFQAHPESNELKMIAAALLCPRLPSQAIESSMDSESHYFAVLAPIAPKGTSRVGQKGPIGDNEMSDLVQRELDRIGTALRRSDPVPRYDELYAMQQALLWVMPIA
jgi:hypothetical protein